MQSSVSISGILADAVRFFKFYARVIFQITVMVCFPVYALLFLAVQAADAANGLAASAMPGSGGVISTLLSLYVSAAVTLLANAYKTKEPPPAPKPFLLTILRRYPAILGTTIVGGFLIALLLACLVLPGIFFAIVWVFFFQAVVVRGKIAIDALTYSFQLVKGRWWKTFGYYMALMGCGALVYVPALTFGSFAGGFFQALAQSSEGLTSVLWLIRAVLQTAVDLSGTVIAAIMAAFFFRWEETSPLLAGTEN